MFGRCCNDWQSQRARSDTYKSHAATMYQRHLHQAILSLSSTAANLHPSALHLTQLGKHRNILSVWWQIDGPVQRWKQMRKSTGHRVRRMTRPSKLKLRCRQDLHLRIGSRHVGIAACSCSVVFLRLGTGAGKSLVHGQRGRLFVSSTSSVNNVPNLCMVTAVLIPGDTTSKSSWGRKWAACSSLLLTCSQSRTFLRIAKQEFGVESVPYSKQTLTDTSRHLHSSEDFHSLFFTNHAKMSCKPPST